MSDDAVKDEGAEAVEPEMIDIIVTQPGIIAGKGLVHPGSRHTIKKEAYSEHWMIPGAKTADEIMQIDPRQRYNVDLSTMKPDELKVLMAKLEIKTKKQKMKREDVERLIMSRLVEIAESEDDEDE